MLKCRDSQPKSGRETSRLLCKLYSLITGGTIAGAKITAGKGGHSDAQISNCQGKHKPVGWNMEAVYPSDESYYETISKNC